jgi:hypothetical protein
MTSTRPRVSARDSVVAHVAALALTAVVILVLHAGDHASFIVLGVGVGVYGVVLGGSLLVARSRARRRSQRERANFETYTTEHNRRLGRD